MIEWIMSINGVVNKFIWGIPAMVCIIGVGMYLSFRTRFIQIRKFGFAMKTTIGKMFNKKESSEGSLTPFQAVCTALAATVGTGNIAGVAGAIALGGPGAVFWMWISAILGMCTKFAEVTLAVHYRKVNDKGDYVGGPMYYITNGLGQNWRWLASIFCCFGILAVFGVGNTAQVNTIVAAINSVLINYSIVQPTQLMTTNYIIGIIIVVLVASVLLGGVKRIGKVNEKLVPFMALIYILISIGVLIIHYDKVPLVFSQIFKGAFSPSAVTGGVVGSLFLSMKNGVSRGIFSNEAGLGTGSIAHACADTSKPIKQGMFGIFEVFTDTIIICTLTALVILCSGQEIMYGHNAGAELTIAAFVSVYGNFISLFTAVSICCFAFSTIIGWGLYGSRFAEFLLGVKSIKVFFVLYSLVSILGATMDLEVIWAISDTFNGLMTIPNLIGVFLLSKVVVQLAKEYFQEK